VDCRRGLDAALAGEKPGEEIGRPLWRRCGRGRRRDGAPDQEWTDDFALAQQWLQSKADPQVYPLVMPVRVTGKDHGKERAAKSAVERLKHIAAPAMPKEHAVDENRGAANYRAAPRRVRCSAACDPHFAFRHPYWRADATHRFLSG